MVKIWHSQNSNPLTDYDETLHNWLRRPREHVIQTLYKSVEGERLGKYVKHKAKSFYYFLYQTRLLKWPLGGFWRKWFQRRGITQGCAFFGSEWWMASHVKRGKSTKTGMAFYRYVRRSSLCDWSEDECRRRRMVTDVALFSAVHCCRLFFRVWLPIVPKFTSILLPKIPYHLFSSKLTKTLYVYALLVTFSSTNLEIHVYAVALLWFLFWQFCMNYSLN